ncbi:MAG: hypothetical protein NTV79_10720 [Candidatus Aureabacteria bacterium]|nr:hypothetical protein [Candidatus Auribacterota bacterium]
MTSPLASLTQLKKTAASRGWFRDKRFVQHGIGPLGAYAFQHFLPPSLIVCLYHGDEVERYMEKEWPTKVISYEKLNGVRVCDGSDFHDNFFRDYGDDILKAAGGASAPVDLVPFAPSWAIHEFLYRRAPAWRHLANSKIMQDFFEFKSRLALEAKKIGIPMPPASLVKPFGQLEYRFLADKYPDGFVIQTPLSAAGKGTEFVFTEDDFHRVVDEKRTFMGEAFASTPAKVTPFLSGPSPNMTGCVVNGTVVLSQPDIQIVGDPYFVKTPGQYIGSDFTVKAFSPEQTRLMRDVVRRIGEWMGSLGYRGNFGVDFLSTVDKNNRVKDISVSEVNARLVGEYHYLSDFQAMKDCVPLSFFHLAEWMNIREITPKEIAEYNESLPEVEGSALALYTREKGIFRAAGGITAGIYRLENGKPQRVRDGYLASHCRGADEFAITAGVPWEGLVIGHPRFGDYNVNICYLYTRDSIVDPNNFRVVSKKWREIADAVVKAFELTPCEPRQKYRLRKVT